MADESLIEGSCSVVISVQAPVIVWAKSGTGISITDELVIKNVTIDWQLATGSVQIGGEDGVREGYFEVELTADSKEGYMAFLVGIVNTASMWGKTAVAEFSAYCASKHAVIGLTRSLAQELAPRQISVNAVCPGWVRTVASTRSLSFMATQQGRTESDLLNEIVSAQALEGLMEPQDMVDMYLFLSGPAADNITGQSFTVDRGELMQ